MNKKSQAALEFITTYGWSILVVLIAVSGLSYFGILNTDLFLPSTCSLTQTGIICTDFAVEDQRVVLVLQNSLGKTITINQVTVANGRIECTNNNSVNLNNNARISEIIFCDIGTANKRFIGVINITYITEERILHKISGYLRATVSGNSVPNASVAALNLDCSVSSNCQDTVLFKISALYDGHAEISNSSIYDNKVCCRSTTDTLSNSCASPQAVLLHLSSNTDAHVEKNTQSNYNVSVCLSGNTNTVSCRYETSCLADESCVVTISADTDAHVGDCVTQPFATKICCKIA